MFPKLFATVFLALFVVAAQASVSAPELERAIGDPCSASDPCVGGICCLARKRGVLQTRGTCLSHACPGVVSDE
ncbi:hypothetical protein C8F01DRAFT_1245354 [Mycena amicta]|nr:hypothetical protein C8F01DRAFT_1245354 [Mycena amicta]